MRTLKALAPLGFVLALVSACRLVDNPYLPVAEDGSETATSTSSSTETDTETDTSPDPIDTDTDTDTETETGPDPETETETETSAEEFLWCPDLDGDGFGDGMSSDCGWATADQAPPEHVANTDDCDDTSAFTHPGAAEDDDPTACMRDEDDDGWGSSVFFPNVAPGRDCDDLDPAAVVCVEVIDACLDTNLDVAVQLDAMGTGGTGTYGYSWTPVETLDDPLLPNPLAQPTGTTTYAVTATDDFFEPNQGSAEATVHVMGTPWILTGDQTTCSTVGFDVVGDAVMFQSAPEGTQLCTLNSGVPTGVVCPVQGNGARVSVGFDVAGSAPNSDGYLAVVWGWQSTSRFYALLWKRGEQDFGNCVAEEGVVVKRFDKLADYALETDFACSTSTNNQTVLLDPSQTFAGPWLTDHDYRVVIEQGGNGTHIEIHDDTLMSEVASFMVADTTYPTGRVGLLFLSQPELCAGPVVSQCQ